MEVGDKVIYLPQPGKHLSRNELYGLAEIKSDSGTSYGLCLTDCEMVTAYTGSRGHHLDGQLENDGGWFVTHSEGDRALMLLDDLADSDPNFTAVKGDLVLLQQLPDESFYLHPTTFMSVFNGTQGEVLGFFDGHCLLYTQAIIDGERKRVFFPYWFKPENIKTKVYPKVVKTGRTFRVQVNSTVYANLNTDELRTLFPTTVHKTVTADEILRQMP